MSAHFSPMNTLYTSKVEWTNNTLTVWNHGSEKTSLLLSMMKLAGPKVTFKFLLELHLERKNNTKRPHVKTKAKEFSSLCHCYHRFYNGDKCPLRITLLDRFESNLDNTSPWSKSLKIYENLTDELSMKLLERKLSIKTTEHFCTSGGLFNCEEKGKTLLPFILKLGGPWNCFCKLTSNLSTTYFKTQKLHHERGVYKTWGRRWPRTWCWPLPAL